MHVHILPRRRGDFSHIDDVYGEVYISKGGDVCGGGKSDKHFDPNASTLTAYDSDPRGVRSWSAGTAWMHQMGDVAPDPPKRWPRRPPR